MKKILILSLCTLFFLTNLTFAENTKTFSQSSYDNNPPNPPGIIGPTSGATKQGHIYSVTVSDPDEEDLLINIEVNFGDGITTCGGCDGLGPWHSGDVQQFTHSWTRSGTYQIKGRVQDEHGVWSAWSDPLPVTMPYTYTSPFQQFFEVLFQQFPYAFQLFQHMMGY